MNNYRVVDQDPQKQAVYKNKLCGSVENETLPKDSALALKEAIWKENVELPVQEPKLNFSDGGHTYYAWKHQITLDCSESSVSVSKLLHELAHAKLGALGIGPFVETHGPLFLLVFGRMWSTYSTKSEEQFYGRCEGCNLKVASKLPDLEQYPWAVVEEGGMEYAVRPAQRAIEIGWNIVRTFNTKISENHPMGAGSLVVPNSLSNGVI